MKKFNEYKGITLITLVITVIILLILAGVTINLALGENGIINTAKTASEETRRQSATESINLKITNVQIKTYAEKKKMPTLQELADEFCNDSDFSYVTLSSQVSSLTHIDVNGYSSIFTKLKDYPYEFEINSLLQLASIDGVKISTNNTSNNAEIEALKSEISALKNNYNSLNEKYTQLRTQLSSIPSVPVSYSFEEQVVGTWIDGKPLYKKTWDYGSRINVSNTTWTNTNVSISENNIDHVIKAEATSPGTSNDDCCWALHAHTEDSVANVHVLAPRDGTTVGCRYFTFYYTKTTD